jgi:hypothetical protein
MKREHVAVLRGKKCPRLCSQDLWDVGMFQGFRARERGRERERERESAIEHIHDSHIPGTFWTPAGEPPLRLAYGNGQHETSSIHPSVP